MCIKEENKIYISSENLIDEENRKNINILYEISNEINLYEDYEKMYLDFAQKFLTETSEHGGGKFGLALMRKLTEGNLIELSEGEHFNPGFKIKLTVDL